MKVISLSHSEAGMACSISMAIKKYFYNDSKETDFFDFLLVSIKSVNEVLLGKTIDFVPNTDPENALIQFKDFHHMTSVHDLENIKKQKNEIDADEIIIKLVEKYNRRRDRLINDIKKNDKIYFVRFCKNLNDIEQEELDSFFKNIKNINDKVDVHLILVTFNYRKHQSFVPLKLLNMYPNIHMMYLDNYLMEKEIEMNYSFITNEFIKLQKFNEFITNLKPLYNFVNNIEDKVNKNAVLVLTRGYSSYRKYFSLIQRNKSISKNLRDKTTDIIIFNEGNIIEKHQELIKKETPDLNIKFVTITEKAFLKQNEIYQFYHTTKRDIWHYGYRHMCHFWFIDFLHFCNDYDFILRIDEDCIIDFNVDEIFNILPSKLLIAGTMDKDDEEITHGLNQFTLNFLRHNGFIRKPKKPNGPYTNILGLNLLKLNKNLFVKKYMECVDKSNSIYIYRWGDLPLWGEILEYFYKKEDYLLYNKINYYHGSLNVFVNKITKTIQREKELLTNQKQILEGPTKKNKVYPRLKLY